MLCYDGEAAGGGTGFGCMRSWMGGIRCPTSGVGYLEELERQFREIGVGALASVSGRYFAMDRDLRWEKVEAGVRRNGFGTGSGERGTYRDAAARVT